MICESCWKEVPELLEIEDNYICNECFERIEVNYGLFDRTDEQGGSNKFRSKVSLFEDTTEIN